MSIILSNLRNPYVNLAIEHYLFTTLENTKLLFLYTNDTCAVIGRNQNPWREVNIPLANKLRIPVVRRRSGGGTVVHDKGNVNFSFMTDRDSFSRDGFSSLIVELMNQTVAEEESKLDLNARHDIIMKISRSKVSGSAYKVASGRAYHHGTMLLNSDLNTLKSLLHRDVSRLGSIEGRGVTSVRSPVENAPFSKDVFIQTVMTGFWTKYGHRPFGDESLQFKTINKVGDLGAAAAEQIEKYVSETIAWDWIYGKTPRFTHTLTDESGSPISFTVEKGRITSAVARDLPYKGEILARNTSIPSWVPESIDGYRSPS